MCGDQCSNNIEAMIGIGELNDDERLHHIMMMMDAGKAICLSGKDSILVMDYIKRLEQKCSHLPFDEVATS